MTERRKLTPEEVKTPAYQARAHVEAMASSGMIPQDIHDQLRADREHIRQGEAGDPDRKQRIWRDNFGICAESELVNKHGLRVPEGSSLVYNRLVPPGRSNLERSE